MKHAKQIRARLSVSSWSLHRTLGSPPSYGPDSSGRMPNGKKKTAEAATSAVALLDLPAQLAEFGIHTMELCHFHLPSRDAAYLDELRSAFADAKLELWAFLVDGGDITDPKHHARDVAWIEGWIPIAARLGAENVRVAAGKQTPNAETTARSRRGLMHLCERSADQGLHLMTENWLSLASTPDAVLDLYHYMDGRLRLCVDFGNWRGPEKYEWLDQIMPYAASCHAKAHFDNTGTMDRVDYMRCLDLCRTHDFAGPYTLIYDGPSADEWAGLDEERKTVAEYLPT